MEQKKDTLDVQNENSRADTYKLLSECYYSPSESLFDLLNGPEKLAEDFFTELVKKVPAEDGINVLKEDYAKLFVGPFKLLAAPYGSVYLDGQRQVMGQSTVDVQKLYKEEGLKLEIKDAPDHIAAELEFMYLLIFRQQEAARDKNNDLIVQFRDKQKHFLRNYLGSWIPEFTELVEKSAETEFYKKLAHLTRIFVEKELNNLISVA